MLWDFHRLAGVSDMVKAIDSDGAVLSILTWQNLVFYIPLVLGVLLGLGLFLGGAHEPDGHAGSLHGEHSLEGDHSHSLGWASSLLGVGRVPLTIVWMLASLVFGAAGVIVTTLLASLRLHPWLGFFISLVSAFTAMVTVTGWAARFLQRVLPTQETYRVSRHDFAGCTGVVLLPTDERSGYAQVKDPEGNVHNVRCRAVDGALPKGAPILVVTYDEATQACVVELNPK